jgi:dipeptidyl-peptidase-3
MGKVNPKTFISDSQPVGQTKDDFNYFVEQFDDIRVLKYRLPDFESLTLQEKEYIYYLSQAALAGRDILWDQNFKHNLQIRKTIEAIIESYSGDKKDSNYEKFLIYAKKIFFSNGIHHHYSSDKFRPGFSSVFFSKLFKGVPYEKLPLENGQTADQLSDLLIKVIFDDKLYSKKVELQAGVDLIMSSATNFYEGVTQVEVEKFYSERIIPGDPRPISLGLNSRTVKINGVVSEEVYCSNGKYGSAIENVIHWLRKAIDVAESDARKRELLLLIAFYNTGDLRTWDEYNIAWAKNTTSMVDYINGFIENYEDPLGMKATWEAIVDYADLEATKRTKIITENAQWFEDNSPIHPQYRKKKVTGVAAKVINIAMLGGDCYPASPLGINLPNADWIRKEVGSKSVTLANISNAIEIASLGNGFLEEFAADKAEVERIKKYGSDSDALHTDALVMQAGN